MICIDTDNSKTSFMIEERNKVLLMKMYIN
jgi:hypothetical protein